MDNSVDSGSVCLYVVVDSVVRRGCVRVSGCFNVCPITHNTSVLDIRLQLHRPSRHLTPACTCRRTRSTRFSFPLRATLLCDNCNRRLSQLSASLFLQFVVLYRGVFVLFVRCGYPVCLLWFGLTSSVTYSSYLFAVSLAHCARC